MKALLNLIPYGCIGEPADIGNAMLWLASDLPDHTNPTTMFVDGRMPGCPSFRGAG